jgi:hypothetical protein
MVALARVIIRIRLNDTHEIFVCLEAPPVGAPVRTVPSRHPVAALVHDPPRKSIFGCNWLGTVQGCTWFIPEANSPRARTPDSAYLEVQVNLHTL